MTRVQELRAATKQRQRTNRRRRFGGGSSTPEFFASETGRTGVPRTLDRPLAPKGRYYFGATVNGRRYYVDSHSRAAANRRRDAALRKGHYNVSSVLERRR